MIISYKYYIHNQQNLTDLNNLTNIAGKIYNHCIRLHKKYYKLYGKHLNKFQLQKHLTKLKKLDKYSYWKSLGSQAIQELTERIDEAYKKFFKFVTKKSNIKSGIPTFKKSLEYPSFKLKGYVGFKLNNNKLIINKKSYRFKKHRDFEGEIKTCTIKRDKTGQFYLILSVETEITKKLPHTGNAVGMDFGFKTFLTKSDKTTIEYPEFYKSSLNKIQQLNKVLSRKTKGSNNRKRAKLKLSKMHKKLANQREDWQWKIAYELVSNYDIIKVEDLDINSMKALYGRKVSDLAYYNFLLKLEHLCNKYNKKLIKVDRYFPSSQICSNCGNIDKSMKDVNIREYNCKACYKIIDRDENAAINIENYNELLHKSLGKSLKSNKHKTSITEAVCVPF